MLAFWFMFSFIRIKKDENHGKKMSHQTIKHKSVSSGSHDTVDFGTKQTDMKKKVIATRNLKNRGFKVHTCVYHLNEKQKN